MNVLSYYASTALEAKNVLVTKMNGKKNVLPLNLQ